MVVHWSDAVHTVMCTLKHTYVPLKYHAWFKYELAMYVVGLGSILVFQYYRSMVYT